MAWLGWPEQHWESLAGWVAESQQVALNKDPVAGKALADFFSNLVKVNLDVHRIAPNEIADATDALLNTEVEGVRLDDEQIVSVLRNWAAGHGTVVAGLGLVVLNLAQDTELQGRLRIDHSLIPAAIEEILRVDGPLVDNSRTTTCKVNIQGQSIAKGERLTLMWIAANRDPRAFDDPTAVMLDRNTDASLAWGQGIHFCQGAPLARLEMRVALEELLARTTHFKLVGESASSRAAYPGNGLTTLHLLVS
ncbi:MAG: cytochrome P450 [Nitrosomonadales bacterium]|nr:cytochrome P450 [Nitrosomonadales bacterium]